MNYKSVADLNDDLLRNLNRLPRDLDLIVGVPRSGLLAANLLALALNLPLADLEGFLAGRTLSAGRTRRRAGFDGGGDALNVLVVDDSINSGKSIREARAAVARAGLGHRVQFCAVYGLEPSHPDVDIVIEAVPQPRLFQWNLMHHPWLEHCCVDIDGVLCCDPTHDENDDGPNYERFLLGAAPMHVPTKPIGWLVTSRLERYRPQTEAWLAQAGIQYRNLVMLDLATKAERQRAQAHGVFKAGVYRNVGALLFIESEIAQAKYIARVSGKPVLCIEAQQVFRPDALSPLALAQAVRTLPTRLKIAPRPVRSVKTAARRMLGETLYGGLKRVVKAGG